VVEGDAGPLAGATADRRAGETAAEGPEPGLGPGEDLLLGLADRDPDVVVAQDRGDRQAGAERDRLRQRRLRLGAQRQQAAAPAPQGQERGEGAAAEGAEQSSAPEARR